MAYFARFDAGQPRAGSAPRLAAAVASRRAWPILLEAARHRHAFVAEAGLVALGRAARTEVQRAAAREILESSLTHRNHLIARCGSIGLQYVADEGTLAKLLTVAGDQTAEADVRAFAALGAAVGGADAAVGLFQSMIETQAANEGHELRASGIMGLGTLRGAAAARAVPLLQATAYEKKDVKPKLRALAVESLGRLEAAVVPIALLDRALGDPETRVRRAGAVAIARRGGPGTARVLAMLRKDDDPLTRRIAAVSLGRLAAAGQGSAEAVAGLRAAFESAESGLREFALLGLALSGDASALTLATTATQHANPSTRSAACIALGMLCIRGRVLPWLDAKAHGTTRAALLQRLAKDANPFVRAYAALALGMLGGVEVDAPIRGLLEGKPTPEERAYALLALALAGDPEAGPIIVKSLRKEHMRNGFIAGHLAYALGLTKDRRPSTLKRLETLAAQLDGDWDMYVSAVALMCLGSLSGDRLFTRRHVFAAGHDYMLESDFVQTWFYML